jgi:integrase
VHDLRHAAATHWLAAGLTPHAVARLLGHADPTLVLRRYGHALPDELARAGVALESFRRARSRGSDLEGASSDALTPGSRS